MEICDDGNRINGDGCSSSCSVEVGYVCEQALRMFTAGTCGNNGQTQVASKADCEAAARQLAVGGTAASTIDNSLWPAGCSFWQSSLFWNAAASSQPCSRRAACVCASGIDTCAELGVCGDGTKTVYEECDDSGLTDGDGCSSTCSVEAGFQCGPSGCSP